MMAAKTGVLLTGATGFLGRVLLHELLQTGVRVAVLARDRPNKHAEKRLRDLTDSYRLAPAARAPVTLISGDLHEPGLGLSAIDRGWIMRNCSAVIHSAACVSFQSTSSGESRRTNVEGTRRLIELCEDSGIRDFHHVSTAFVCGKQPGPVRESDMNPGPFRNAYEESKWEAERCLRNTQSLRTTVYRPSVIVGDSVTGETTSYHGFYRFLEMADRLARPDSKPDMRRLPLKLPFSGEERRDLVPVDWVARAITRIMQRPQWHGKCFHLTSPRPIPVREIKAVVEHELGLTGMRFEAESSVTSTESGKRVDAVYRDALRSYWPYFAGDPEFDRSNTLAALPNLPGVEVTAPVIARLIRFAVANNWGRTPIRSEVERLASCADYFEQFLPAAIADSFLADLAVTATLGFEVRGPDGGHWVYRIHEGQILEVSCDESIAADVDYRLDMPTFAKIVSGQQTPQAAFFARKVEIHGRMEMGLKLAMLFGQFVKESPYCFDQPERHHVTVR